RLDLAAVLGADQVRLDECKDMPHALALLGRERVAGLREHQFIIHDTDELPLLRRPAPRAGDELRGPVRPLRCGLALDRDGAEGPVKRLEDLGGDDGLAIDLPDDGVDRYGSVGGRGGWIRRRGSDGRRQLRLRGRAMVVTRPGRGRGSGSLRQYGSDDE